MTNQEMKLLLEDLLRYVPVENRELYEAIRNLIQLLNKQPVLKHVGMIERCLFCGQVIPSRKVEVNNDK